MAIPTRLHGLIDYGVAAGLAGLAAGGRLPRPIGRVLGAAGLAHAGYALLTDYEAGIRAVLTMRRHLALDAAGGAALCAAGLLLRGQPIGGRLLLVAIGLTELAVVSLSDDSPVSGPGQGSGPVGRLIGGEARSAEIAGYAPLDSLKPVAENVFIVDSLLSGPLGLMLPVRMTVVRLPSGEVLLHSPTRFSHALRRELEALGPIRHLVAPNVAHWMFLKDWQTACPDATSWVVPGLRQRRQVRRSGVRLNRDLGTAAPAEWGDAIMLLPVPGGLGFLELALFHMPSRTLMLTDLVLNLEPSKLPAVLRPLARLFGVTAPHGMPPPYLRAVIRLRRQAASQAASRLLALQPDRVVFAHGRWFDRDATAALRRSLRWLID